MRSPLRIALIAVIAAAYALAFPTLYNRFSLEVAALSVLPVAAAGWLFGRRAGLLAGLLAIPLHVVLLNLGGWAGLELMLRHGMLGSAVVITIGMLAGLLSELFGRVRRQAKELAHEREALRNEINERKRVMGALRESEARLQLMIKQLPAILWTTDTDLVFTSGAGAGLMALGIQPNQFADLSLYAYFQTDSPDFSSIAAHQRALSGDSAAFTTEWAGRSYQVHVEPFLSNDRIIGCIGIALDITDQARAEQSLRAVERKLLESQKLESLGALAGGIAHDFNNLLTTILGNIELALDELPPNSHELSLILPIEVAARRAAALTQQLLAYTGKEQVLAQPIDVNLLIAEAAPLLNAAAGESATLRYALAPCTPVIIADPRQIRQILLNLTLNAAEAIGERQGEITITTASLYADHDRLAATYLAPDLPAGVYVLLSVADTGSGMDAATQARIFEPFFTTRFTGRGLGLAAVLGIVRAHQGAVEVHSEAGRGTVLTILLPAAPAQPAVQDAPEQTSPPLNANAAPVAAVPVLTALVIDDEPSLRQMAARMLKLCGFNVLTAVDGQTAIEICRTNAGPIDVVLLDMLMPRMSGEETFYALHELRPNARIILMSGYDRLEAVQRLVEQGLASILHKPFSLTDLRAKVQQLTRQTPE